MIITYNIPVSKQEALHIMGYDNIEVKDIENVKEFSAYGTPIFMPIRIEDVRYKKDGVIHKINGIKLLCAVMEISNTRNIVKTDIQGRDGSVKEFINNGDYQISIKGILSNDVYTPDGTVPSKGNNKYPMDAVAHLNTICTAPCAIHVTNSLLYTLGIYDLVIEDFSFPATQGKENIQAFQLNCLSDTTFILQEKEENKILHN